MKSPPPTLCEWVVPFNNRDMALALVAGFYDDSPDQSLMRESISYIDGLVHLCGENGEVEKTIMYSKALRKWCYYE